ncbi:MAG: haloacid dehalogenase-like hydrolase [Planctomycetes bacterium]|nr:haloacid dehalogenase-like hydrolase [Planctomycetota bacterium]
MTPNLDLSHEDALRLATRAGELVACVYGRPDLVVGIQRGGTAVAGAFADGARAGEVALVGTVRQGPRRLAGDVRTRVRDLVPRGLRRLYKRMLFTTVVRATKRLHARGAELQPADRSRLRSALTRKSDSFVVVVDDAIDTGSTAAAVLEVIAERPNATRVLLFALTSTAGVVVHPAQLTLFEGIVDYHEGDLGELSEEWRTRLAERRDAPGPSKADAAPPTLAKRDLYLDLDGTLVPNSFRSAIHTLLALHVERRRFGRWLGLLAGRVARRLRLTGHGTLLRLVDHQILSLPEADRTRFQERLAARLTGDARAAMVGIAHAPAVRARIVTAALRSYAPAIERAFGIPVLTGSGRQADGTWRDVTPAAKVAAIRDDTDAVPRNPSLLIGDTMLEALSSTADLDVAIVPPWDRTGLLTVLGATSWWSAGRSRTLPVHRPGWTAFGT